MQIKRRKINDLALENTSLPKILQRIYSARGISNIQACENQLKFLLPFDSLLDINKAAARIEKAMITQEHIKIVGDFDADGATATALAISALKKMGARNLSFLVPNRFFLGYGLTKELLYVAKNDNPGLIITVDNGISSVEGVEYANELGIDVLITDHHLAGDILPRACAIVNPNQPGDPFPSKALAGVGVIFYVMLALRRLLQNSNWFKMNNIAIPNMAQFLDLVALGTVADVVPLDHNNRILVSQGMKRIKQGLMCEGIKALIEISKRNFANLSAVDLGYVVAPRLNAAGRLDDMSLGIDCLLSDKDRARTLSIKLNALNDERRIIEEDMKIQAFSLMDALKKNLQKKSLPAGICIMDPAWHQGVIGILAGRMKELYHRPVIVFSKVSATELKGSARSVKDVNIRDVLAQINATHPKLIAKFGGHAMAAGVSLPPESFPLFKKCFEKEVAKIISAENCSLELWTDGPLSHSELTLETAKILEAAGPWGSQFPEPSFEGEFYLIQQRIVGDKHLKATLQPIGSKKFIEAIAFNVNLNEWPNHRVRSIRAVYVLAENFYQNIAKLQLVLQHFEVYNDEMVSA